MTLGRGLTYLWAMKLLAARAAFLLPLLLLAACPEAQYGAECRQNAIQDADGSPNNCDLQACLDCADACDGFCMALEMSPHLWMCGEETFSGADYCDASVWPPGAAAE